MCLSVTGSDVSTPDLNSSLQSVPSSAPTKHASSPFETFGAQSPLPLDIAEQVCALFREQYGERYPSRSALDPALYQQEVGSDRVRPVISRAPQCGSVQALSAILALDEGVLEIGKILVAPQARGNGLGALVTTEAVRQARAERPNLLLAWCFTAHAMSQRIFEPLGFKPIGLMVQDWADVFNAGAREGALVMADPNHVRFSQPREVFVPEALKPVLSFVYSQLGCDRTFSAAKSGSKSESLAVLPSVDANEFPVTGSLATYIPPGTPREQARVTLQALEAQNPEHISVRINISDPAAHEMVNELLADGFFYALVQPFAHGDVLTLQRNKAGLKAAAPKISLNSNEAKQLLGLMMPLV